MNAVGIDVSKGKSMVAIMRPFGEIVSAPVEIKYTASDINSLVELINSVEGEARIVMGIFGHCCSVTVLNSIIISSFFLISPLSEGII